jgi:N-acetylglucosaminyldiphosphoundecaprenol N-acetyl-beta-D-mannosaminyltransferase
MSNKAAKTVALFGLPIANVTMAEAVVRIEECIASGRTHQIATANLDFARNSLRDAYLQRVICDCTMVLPDGAPMLWASWLFRTPLQERVTGVDLIPELARLSAQRGYRIYLLGASEESSHRAARVLEMAYPGCQIVGRYSPRVLPLHAMDDVDILRRIDEVKPHILLVAFGNPKQEIWIHRNRKRLKVPVAIGIGGALDMIAGSLKRAPVWIQHLQFEWLYRTVQEPARLLPRYVNDALALARHLPLGVAVNRLQPGHLPAGKLRVPVLGGVRVTTAPEALSGDMCAALTTEAAAAVKETQMLVIDISGTTRIEADGLGCLLEVRRVMMASGMQVWLAGMSNPVKRVLQFSAMLDLFLLAPTLADAVRLASVGHSEVQWRASVMPASVTTGQGVPIGTKTA